MLCKQTTLRHPSGTTIKTPLLVPSFSSKGLSMNRKSVSEANEIIKATQEAIIEAFLISAYDLSHRHIIYDFEYTPEIIIIDSGGYETSEEFDLSATWRYQSAVKKWSIDQYRKELDSWPQHVPAIIVSFDNRVDFGEQIQSAKELFNAYPNHLHDFLLKPDLPDKPFLELDILTPHTKELCEFAIIGVTEKELGNSLLERMLAIAQLRKLLNSHDISAPIHVFGSLDPITSSLYFLAGAEIFDGLTWIKYSYIDGRAIYYQNYTAIKGIHVREDRAKAKSLIDNIYFLQELQNQMRVFLHTEDFSKFGSNADLLRESYHTFLSRGGEK